MSDWKLQPGVGGPTTYRRDLHDPFVVYVAYEIDWEQDQPVQYTWSVQDGSCGRVLEHGWVDGDQGLEVAKRTADAAVAQLFPERSL
jgi:hypothetical protein